MLTKAMFIGRRSTPTPQAVFSVADGHTVTSLRWTGEIDVTQVPELRDEILALPADRSVHLDLSTVSYLDSCGLGMLVLLRKRLARRGVGVTLFDVQPQVRRVLEITGLNRAFRFASASGPADADEVHVAETQPE
jgi:anti-sigma B factor antagonist